ncbi:MAG: hypothetical protein LBT00_01155 [Spirochaetaceae bacterium]|nr:hypothetical protein [Spirochaetaceae bacterium]
MRLPRELAENVWYEVRTEINVGGARFARIENGELKMDNVVFWRLRVLPPSFSIIHLSFSIPRRGGAAPTWLD